VRSAANSPACGRRCSDSTPPLAHAETEPGVQPNADAGRAESHRLSSPTASHGNASLAERRKDIRLARPGKSPALSERSGHHSSEPAAAAAWSLWRGGQDCPARRRGMWLSRASPAPVFGKAWRTSRSSTSIANHCFSWQSTSTLLVTPLVTTTGPEARQSAAPPSYCGLCPETVYLPTGTGTGNRPFAPTVMPVMPVMGYFVPFTHGGWLVRLGLAGPPQGHLQPGACRSESRRTWGPVGDEQLASETEAAMTGSRGSKVRDYLFERTRQRSATSRDGNALEGTSPSFMP
jgi:hypothetical protein